MFQGDSGSPLMCLKDDKYCLCGITSGGSATCSQKDGNPVFFTSMCSASILLWIRENAMMDQNTEPELETTVSITEEGELLLSSVLPRRG